AGEGIAFTPGTHAAVADQPDAFAAAILALIDDPAAAAAMGAAASAHMAEAYSWDAQLSRFDAALARLGVAG
ncbi:MAG: glycosyltransferase, partial [Pseudomonadota bacterium]